jgi:glycosyltransferase involved in cell wall biosynthesis
MSRPLAILHTEASLGWGGQEMRILSEARGFIARGHKVTLACPAEARIYQEAPAWGVPAVALPIGKKRPAGLGALIDLFRNSPPDLVSTHSSTDTWLAALALLVLRRPFPLVRTRHISAPVPRNAFSRWLYTKATARIVTTGEALKKELIETNGYAASRIDSVPTGIDATRFRPGERAAARAALGLARDRTVVGIVATLRSWKGHRFLIEAMARLPGSVDLVIVGDGPMREVLEADVDKSGLRPRTRFAGNQSDVVPWLHALDIFALPSYANEGVPQALVQAMLTGLPCVTTHVGSIAEIALAEATAIVVPPRDAAALAGAIERLMRDEALRKRLGEAARAHCAERYSYESMLERMETVYRQALGLRP